jgi:hypothetical protein
MQGVRVDQLSLGVIARSRKENEHRLAIHPLHVERIEAGLRRRIYLERGYGERFGVPDGQLADHVAGLRTRTGGSASPTTAARLHIVDGGEHMLLSHLEHIADSITPRRR